MSIRTRNRMGWTSDRLSPLSQIFVDYCRAGLDGPVLDIGAGFGAAAIAALDAGAEVIANDLDSASLADLVRRRPAHRDRLTAVAGPFPACIRLATGTLAAVHASNILHFLTGKQLDEGLRAIADWLRPGGRVFIQAATPYQQPFAAFAPEYARRVSAGEQWPGWIPKISQWSSHRQLSQMPRAIHLLDDRVLRRAVESAGLVTERAWLHTRPDLPSLLRLDGRETVALIARKP